MAIRSFPQTEKMQVRKRSEAGITATLEVQGMRA